MLVSVKLSWWANHTEINVPRVVEYRAATRSSTDQVHRAVLPVAGRSGLIAYASEKRQVHLEPGILISSNDDGRTIDVEKEDA
jgi:hypothetical protein